MVVLLTRLRRRSMRLPLWRTSTSILCSACNAFGIKTFSGNSNSRIKYYFLFLHSRFIILGFFLVGNVGVPCCLHMPFRQIECDCEFLEAERIMDYSLLVGVHFCDDVPPEKIGMSPFAPSSEFISSQVWLGIIFSVFDWNYVLLKELQAWSYVVKSLDSWYLCRQKGVIARWQGYLWALLLRCRGMQ